MTHLPKQNMVKKIPVEGGIDEEGHYEALSKQPMDFPDALSELLDNAVSASVREEEYIRENNPSSYFRIQITIVEDGDEVHVIVADQGEGMDGDIMAEHVLTSGDNHGDGILNEHGMGLKNSLCVLTKNEGNPPFRVISKTDSMDKHARYNGPFGDSENVEVDDFNSKWKQGIDYLDDPSQGTRVHFTTTFEKFKSTYPRATKLPTLIEALREHLGVYYRHLLEYDQNHITIKYHDGDESEAEKAEVIPIFPVLEENPDNMENYPDDLEVELPVRGDVTYNRGVVNWEKTREKYEGTSLSLIDGDADDPPFRYYYRKNQTSQGVNIVFNGRTLQTSLIEEIWDNAKGFGENVKNDERGTIDGHGDYNDFVGEIILTDHRFDTVNNKIGIDPDCAYWQEVKEELNDNEKYYPIKNGKKEIEKRYKRRLKIKFNEDDVTKDVYEEDGEWGVSIDLRRHLEAGDAEYIYEIKKSRAMPQDIYQLVMYWDAYKRLDSSNENLEKGVLVAERITDRAKSILQYWDDKRTDANGDDYNLEFNSLDNLGISDGNWSNPRDN